MRRNNRSWLGGLKGLISTLALAIGIATFFGSFSDVSTFRRESAAFGCRLFAQPEGCMPEGLQWVIFITLVVACTILLNVLLGKIKEGVGRIRVSQSKRVEARALYLKYLEEEIAHRSRTALPYARRIPIKCYELPGAVEGRHPSFNDRRDGRTLSPMDAFGEYERRLLILGEAGSGKSTVLYEMAQRLIDEARKDESAPLPLLLNLSSFSLAISEKTRAFAFRLPWARTKSGPSTESFDNWLVSSLVRLGVGYLKPPIAEYWVREQNLALLLDGLDEVPEHLQAPTAEAINASEFFRLYFTTPAVICSRKFQYERLSEQFGLRFPLNGAVVLESLNYAEVSEYLRALDQTVVLQALEKHQQVKAFIETPLNVNLLVNAYTELAPADLLDEFSELHFRSRLIDALVSKLNAREAQRIEAQRLTPTQDGERPQPASAFTDEEVSRSLEWLASKLTKYDSTELPLDRFSVFIWEGKGNPTGFEGFSFLGFIQFCLMLYALLNLAAWNITSGRPVMENALYELLITLAVGCISFVGMKIVGILPYLSLGILHYSISSLAGLSTYQQIFLLITLGCAVRLVLFSQSKFNQGKFSMLLGVGFLLANFLTFYILRVNVGSRNVLYLICSAVPVAGMTWWIGKKKDVDTALSGIILSFLFVFAVSYIGVSYFSDITLFIIASLLGMIWCFGMQNALSGIIHFALTTGGLIVAGKQGGLIGASASPLFFLLVKDRMSEGLNYFWVSRIVSPFMLKSLTATGQIPARFTSILRHAARSGLLEMSGQSFKIRQEYRNHFVLRHYIQSLPTATSAEKIAYVAELKEFGEVAMPVLRELSQDQDIAVARVARTAYIDRGLNKNSVADAKPSPAKGLVGNSRLVPPRFIDCPANMADPVYGLERDIEEAFTALTGPESARLVALVAPAGYGKTALLRGLLRRVADEEEIKRGYPATVVCLDGRNRFTLDNVLLAITSATGSRSLLWACVDEAPAEEKLEALWACLGESAPLWLIFENSEHLLNGEAMFRDQGLDKLVEGWGKRQRQAHMIIESRVSPKLRSLRGLDDLNVRSWPLNGMSTESGVAWVREIGKHAAPGDEAEDSVKQLVELFHGVPQWIETAVGLLSAGQAAPGLSSLLQDQTLLQLMRAEEQEARERGFRRVVNQLLERFSPESRTLLGFVAYFPLALPREAVELILPKEKLDAALTELLRSRTLHECVDQAGGRCYLLSSSLQSIVAELALWQPDPDMARRLSELGKELSRNESYLYAPQVLQCASDCFDGLTEDDQARFLTNRVDLILRRSVSLTSVRRGVEAIPALKAVLSLLESLPSEDERRNVELGNIWTRLCGMYNSYRFDEEARSAGERAVELLQPLVDSGRVDLEPYLGRALNNRAVYLQDNGRTEEARQQTARAIELYQRAVSSGQAEWELSLASAIYNSGIFLIGQDKEKALQQLNDARQRYDALLERGLRIEASLARTLNIEQQVLAGLGRDKEALPLAERQMTILQKLVNEGHSQCGLLLANAAHSYARLLYGPDGYDKANPALEVALSHYQLLFDRGFGDATLLVDTMNLYAFSLHQAGQSEKATELYRRMIDFIRSSLDRVHQFFYVLTSAFVQYGEILKSQKQLREAAAMYSQAAKYYDQAADLSDENIKQDLAEILCLLGIAFQSLRRPKGGVPSLERAVKLFEELVESGRTDLSGELAEAHRLHGLALAGDGKNRRAAEALSQAISRFETLINEGQGYEPRLAESLDNRSFCYLSRFQLRKAFADQNRAVSILKQQVERGREDLRSHLELVAQPLHKRARSEEGKTYFSSRAEQ